MHQDFLAYSHRFKENKFCGYLLPLFFTFFFFLYSTDSFSQSIGVKPFVVVLDAGHGGHDSGNTGNGYKESKIALNIVLKIVLAISSLKFSSFQVEEINLFWIFGVYAILIFAVYKIKKKQDFEIMME